CRENSKGSITSSHMRPELEAIRNLSNLGYRVDRASVHSSRISNHAEWKVARLQVSGDFCNEIVHSNFDALVDSDEAHILPADSQKRCCLCDGKMRLA